jgi:hypothetical protein
LSCDSSSFATRVCTPSSLLELYCVSHQVPVALVHEEWAQAFGIVGIEPRRLSITSTDIPKHVTRWVPSHVPDHAVHARVPCLSCSLCSPVAVAHRWAIDIL